MSFEAPLPSVRQKPPRHALLFELIRQRSVAKYVNHRISKQPPADPADLMHLAHVAQRSLGISAGRQAPPR
ncbi:hypothetical protein [Roseovarius sp.]|uniref:hypothetical protein n=1 Tax=Roseovarius sp. TaxID=1486281 RepID=UPI0025E017AA|nr:hypothetical protein [Roseovarius sp.]